MCGGEGGARRGEGVLWVGVGGGGRVDDWVLLNKYWGSAACCEDSLPSQPPCPPRTGNVVRCCDPAVCVDRSMYTARPQHVTTVPVSQRQGAARTVLPSCVAVCSLPAVVWLWPSCLALPCLGHCLWATLFLNPCCFMLINHCFRCPPCLPCPPPFPCSRPKPQPLLAAPLPPFPAPLPSPTPPCRPSHNHPPRT